MSVDALIILCVLGYVFPCFGILRFIIMCNRHERPEMRMGRRKAFPIALLWPIWVPAAIGALFLVALINGIWEVL